MNVLEAAIELLKDSRRSLSAEELARLMVDRKLVARAAAKPLDKQLTAEADDDDGRVVKTDNGYTLRKAKPAAKKAAPPAKKAAPKKAAPPAKKEAARAKAKPAPRGRKKTESDDAIAVDDAAIVEEMPAPPAEMAGFAPAPGAVEPAPMEDAELADDDEDALHERLAVEAAEVAETVEAAGSTEEQTAPMSEEEKALVDLYSEDLSGKPAQAHSEYQDHRTADEDRPMTPEINAREERHKRWEQRRDERRRRRDDDRQRRGGRGDQPRPQGQAQAQAAAAPERGDRPAADRADRGPRPDARPEREARADRPDREARPERADREARPERAERESRDARAEREARPDRAPVAASPAPVVEDAAEPATNGEHVVHRVGNALGDAAWLVFSSLRSNQPMPVRQLAQMMRKRGLIEAEPEQAWPHLKAALLGDERSYRTLGLRPRIVYRGRDLFAIGPVAQSATAGAESGLATALSHLAVATHKVLKERVSRATHAGFERLVHAYLVAVGYQDIDWIKRVPGISYASALPPDGGSQVLVSARSGDSPVDRRGVGELRVGVEAKGFLSGLLLAARELSDDAERELERPGRSISVLCGDALVGALLGSGVGVVTAAAPVRYVDDQLLDELLAG